MINPVRSLPSAAATPATAELPPPGLPGLEPAWSRLVTVTQSPHDPTDPVGLTHRWHVLDNRPDLEALGAAPVGTLLCVHGNPTWSYLWRDLVTAASRQATDGGPAWRVIAVDQLEMGFSERTGALRTLTRRVRDLTDLTDALALDGPVVTVGHDWGGVVSLGWAVDHPELLAGVVLTNTAVHQPEGEKLPAPLRLALTVLGAGTVTTPAFLETTLALARPRLAPDVAAGFRAPYGSADRRGGIGGFVADIPAGRHHPSRAELDRIAEGVAALDVPALLLWGVHDPVFGDRYLADLEQRLPHADVHRYEHAGHLLPQDVDLPVLDWLADRLGDTPTPGPAASPAPSSRNLAEFASDLPRTRRESSNSAEEAEESAGTEAAEEPDGAGGPEESDGTAFRPMWAQLDELAGSTATALVEMAPPTGDEPRVVSWRLLSRRVRELAAGLHAVGVRPGDRVSLLVPPGADLTAVLYACLRLGAVVVVADAGLGLRGLSRAVRGAHPDVVVGARKGLAAARAMGWPGRRIATQSLPGGQMAALGVDLTLADVAELGAVSDLPPEPGPQDPAAILFTSGSTGPAKGVRYTHAQLAAVRDALSRQYDIGVGTGLVAGFAPFALLGPALGTASVTPDMDVTAPRTLTARAVAAATAAVDARVLFLSPAALANVVATAGDLTEDDHAALAGVRTFLSAGAPVPAHLLAAAGELMPGAVPHTPYGMTEGLLMADITLEGIRAAAGPDGLAPAPGGVCVGRPVDGVQVRISALDESGEATGEPAAEPGVTGEIVVSAPHLKDGYDQLWVTDRASRRGLPGPRWHRTGDVGRLDQESRLWVEGRLAHVLRTPHGVLTPVGPEQRVETLPEVLRAAVVGVGPAGTQQVVVVVETVPEPARPHLAEPHLTARVRGVLPSEQAPAAVLVVPALPTDVRHNSKIDRARLAEWAEGVLAGGKMGEP